ncbi:sulfotransferase, partial [Limnospira sp. PMC 917.15]|uniref:sulfotransferase n=1 Tax=Limnospira sp. PMC 917.15 TaxID=2981106 RepID=UPI0028E0F66E
QGKPRWAEKTPDHFQFLPTLFRWYSEACVLFLVRDPRAVAYSTANSPWANKNIPGHAFKWRRSIDILDGLSGDGRVLRVRYEDLARNP